MLGKIVKYSSENNVKRKKKISFMFNKLLEDMQRLCFTCKILNKIKVNII